MQIQDHKLKLRKAETAQEKINGDKMHNHSNPKLILFIWYTNQTVQEAQLFLLENKKDWFFKLANNCSAADKVLHSVIQDQLEAPYRMENNSMMISLELDCLDLLVP